RPSGQVPQPAAPQRRDLPGTGVLGEADPLRRAEDLEPTATTFQPVEPRRQRPAGLVPSETTSEDQDLEHAACHGFEPLRRQGSPPSSKCLGLKPPCTRDLPNPPAVGIRASLVYTMASSAPASWSDAP